jgi:succinate-semialdehyde dehydrogenase/glutarate-semialdehyde dehydrogenase
VSLYGLTKRLGEALGQRFRDLDGLEFVALRYSGIIGPGEATSAGMAQVRQRILQCAAGHDVTIDGASGEERAHLTHVDDAADATCAALLGGCPPRAIYNVAGPAENYVSLRELHGLVREIEPRAGEALWSGRARSVGPVDTARIKHDLGWAPRVTLRDGLAQLLSREPRASHAAASPRHHFFGAFEMTVQTLPQAGAANAKSSDSRALVAELRDRELFRERCLIDGRWEDGRGSRHLATRDPATGFAIGRVPDMGAVEVRRAIDAAARAFTKWSRTTAKERAELLRKWHALTVEHAEDLARILTAEQGKPLAEARGEVKIAADYILWFAEEARRLYGDTIPSPWADSRLMVIKQPVGVCAAITPWNFPSSMVTRKVAPAIAAGCTVVLKPAHQTPHSALALAELAQRAGVPAGVFNIVTGDPAEIGAELCANTTVAKLSFTGSTRVGRLLMQQAAPSVKRISLELGGNAPFIVFEDADLDAAVAGAMISKSRNAGQTCVCANRILVHEAVHDRFAAKLVSAVEKLVVGAGDEPGVTQGPLIDERAVAKVEDHIADALAKGARLLHGGKHHARGGTFFEPTVLGEATPAMKIFREETFGPVAPLFRFKTEEEAVALANDTEYGLASYFYTRDLGRAHRVMERLRTGMVGVNSGLITTEVAPFGGVNQSGLGREGGAYGIEEFVEVKYACVGGVA